jgi:hypothetical protein
MAKTIVIDTEVKGVDQAVSDINKIDNAVDGVNQKNISPKFDTAKTEKSLENLQKKGEQIEKVGQGIAGGFALATGVVGSFGSELGYSAEEIEQAQAKASSFIGILVSIKPVIEGVGSGFKLLGSILKTNPLILLATIIGGIIVSFLDMGAIIDGIKKGFKAFGDAVSATFDFIVEAAMFAIDMYTKFLDVITLGLFDINGAYKGYVKSVNDANEAERKRVEALTKEIKKQQEVIDKLEGQIKSTEKLLVALKKKEDAIVKSYDKEIELLQAAGKSTEEAEEAKLKAVNDSLNQRIKAQEKHLADTIKLMDAESKQHEAMIERNGKFDKVLVTQFQDLNKNRIKDSKATLEQLKIDKDNSDQAIKVNDAKNQKEANDKWKENEEKRRALELEANKLRIQQENEYLDTIAKLQDENFESTLSAEEREKRVVEEKYFALEEAAKNNAEQLAIVTEAKERELATISKKYRDEESRLIAEANAIRLQKENEYLDTIATLEEQNFENTLTDEQRELRAIDEKYFALEEAAKGNAEQLAIINEAKNKELSDSNQKYRDLEENQQKQINDFRVKALSDTLSTLSTLNELFGNKNEANAKKAFQVNKAISIASTLLQTYQSATAAYASQIIPLDPSSVVRGTIAAGLAVAAGLANVAKIASTQFNGGASASGGASGGGVGSSPSLPSVDTSSTPFQFPTVEGNNPQATQQTFVSVTEINNVNNRVQVAEANATFG